MYLRHTPVTKNGKSHTYWRLVRSVRTGNRVRQETVAQLGELDAAGRVRARALAEAIVGVERQPGLFDDPLPTESVTVDLQRFRLERGRRFGDVWLGLRLEVLWERELDTDVVNEEAWDAVAQRGFDEPMMFAAYLNTLRWNCVTATDPRLFQSPFRAGIRLAPCQNVERIVRPARRGMGAPESA
jgi:hypothetical protein